MRAPAPLFLVLWLASVVCAGPPAASWDPERTRALIVGVLRYQDGESFEDFPDAVRNRQDAYLADALRRRGVPAGNVVFLPDERATRAGCEAALDGLLQASRPGETLLLYFTGHGDRIDDQTYLIPHDGRGRAIPRTALSLRRWVARIEADFRGQQVIGVVDCCHSGGLGVEVERRERRLSWLCLASAQADQLSTERWTFTTLTARALLGEPALDLDRDGQVELSELSRYADEELAFNELQLPSVVATGAFRYGLQLAAASGQRRLAAPGPRVWVEEDGVLYRATVRRAEPTRLWVDYPDYGPDEDGWVPRARCAPYRPVHYPPGTKVEVEWRGDWWPAVVLRSRLGLHRIHYDDHEDSWDEWVEPARIRRREDY